jgi:hypothetical protein
VVSASAIRVMSGLTWEKKQVGGELPSVTDEREDPLAAGLIAFAGHRRAVRQLGRPSVITAPCDEPRWQASVRRTGERSPRGLSIRPGASYTPGPQERGPRRLPPSALFADGELAPLRASLTSRRRLEVSDT